MADERNWPGHVSFGPTKTSIDDDEFFLVGTKRAPMSVVREAIVGAPDGSTPGSVLARLDTAEGDIASLGTAVGPLPVAIDALDTRVTTAEGEIDTLQTQMSGALSDIDDADGDIAALQAALAELVGTTIPALDTRVDDLEGLTTGLLLAIGALAAPFVSWRKAADGAGATGAWDSSEDHYYQVTYAAAKHVLTLDADGWDDGAVGQLEILNTGGFGVQIVLANPAHTLNGMSAGAGYALLPGSDIVPSSTVLPARFQVVYYGSGNWGIG